MINSHLRVSTANNPLAQRAGIAVSTYGLVERDLLEVLSNNLNFTYELCVPGDNQLIGFPLNNGTWTGVIGQLTRGEADINFLPVPVTLSRSNVVDQTFPVLMDNLAIMIPYPETENSVSLAISPAFSIGLTSFLATTVVVAVLIWLMHRLKTGGKFIGGEVVIFLVAVTLYQGGCFRFQSTALRLVYGSWLLALFVVLNIYSGTLTSTLLTPNYQLLVHSLEDVVANENINPLVLKGSPAYADLTTSPLPILQKISTRWQRNPNLLVNDSDYIESLLNAPNQVFILSDIVQNRAIGNDLKKVGYCRALTLDKFIQGRTNSITLRKNCPYTSSFNRKSLLLAQSGIIHHFEKRSYTSSYSACSIRELKSKGSQPTSIKLKHFWTVFLTLIIGCLISFFVFLGEILYTHTITARAVWNSFLVI